MSEWLEKAQELIAGYPPWLVLGVFVVVLGLLCVVLSKVMKLLGVLLAIGGLLAGGWFGWQHWQRSKEEKEPPPSIFSPSFDQPDRAVPADRAPPSPPQPPTSDQILIPPPPSAVPDQPQRKPGEIEP